MPPGYQMPYSTPAIVKRCRCSPLHPNRACITSCSPAIVMLPSTSTRRQISGLIFATTARNRYTTGPLTAVESISTTGRCYLLWLPGR